MLKALIILLTLTSLSALEAFSQSSYDYQTGNVYYNNRTSNGSGSVNGYNVNTGSSWRTNYDSQGNMNGTDKNGHYWNYNSSTGTYMNAGTGRICTGQGFARICSGGR